MPLEPLPVNRTPELIFGLVAPIGVDLDVVAELIDITLREMHYNAHVVRLTTLMRAMKIAVPLDLDPDPLTPEQSHISSYKERIAHANAIRGELGDYALAALAVSAIRSFRIEEWQRRSSLATDTPGGNPAHDEEHPLPQQA